jgi:hypothetical protein
MPELMPPRQVHFRHGSGVVVTGWAMFHNPVTDVWEVEWVTPQGRRIVDYVRSDLLLPASASQPEPERPAVRASDAPRTLPRAG